MPFLTDSFDLANGPMIDVVLMLSTPRIDALKQAGLTWAQPIRCRALIDTGASCTAIDPDVARQLQLAPTGSTNMTTPSTGKAPVACHTYDVCLAFEKPTRTVMSVTLPVIECELTNQGFHVLVGRDILSRCLLVYNGAESTFTLAFLSP